MLNVNSSSATSSLEDGPGPMYTTPGQKAEDFRSVNRYYLAQARSDDWRLDEEDHLQRRGRNKPPRGTRPDYPDMQCPGASY